MKKSVLILLAVLLLAFPATISFSQEQAPVSPPARQGQRPGPGGMMGGPRIEWMRQHMAGRPGMLGRRGQMLRLLQTNPKLAGLLMQMRGEMMMRRGEVLMKYGKEIQNLTPTTPPARR